MLMVMLLVLRGLSRKSSGGCTARGFGEVGPWGFGAVASDL